jgi:hypothetical protein
MMGKEARANLGPVGRSGPSAQVVCAMLAACQLLVIGTMALSRDLPGWASAVAVGAAVLVSTVVGAVTGGFGRSSSPWKHGAEKPDRGRADRPQAVRSREIKVTEPRYN